MTECVTGVDLVRLQFQIAQGQPLPFEPANRLSGHAIEAPAVRRGSLAPISAVDRADRRL